MSEEDLKKSVKINLRGVTQSRKGGVPLNQLQNDYKDFIGRDIPLKDLGYSSLEYFLRDIPDVISLKRDKDGVVVAEGVADASTAHIAKLISKQKTSKSASTKPAVLYRKKGNTLKTAKENQKSSHAKLKNMPVKTEGEFPEQCSKPGQLNPENHELKKSVLIHLKSVVQSCKGGVPLNRLDKDYRAFIGKNIPFKELGYDSLENFIRSIPDVISLKKNAKGVIIALGVSDSSTAHLFGQKTIQESSKVSETLDSAKNLPDGSTVIRISAQKNAKLPSFFQLPQNASETDLKNGLKISSNGNSFNHGICQSVDSNAQPSLSKIPQKKANKNNTEFSAVIHSEPISSTANSKMNNSNAEASERRNTYPSNLNLKQNTTMNLSNQNLDYTSTLLNGDSTCNLKHQLKDGNIPDSETVSGGKVNRMNGIHSNSSNSSFDESTQRLNNVLIPSLVQAFSAVPEKLNMASKMSFRSSSADLDCIEPSAIGTIVSKRGSRGRARKRIKDISNTLKIEDNTKDAERSNSQAALHSSQEGLTNTGAFNYTCNAPESTYPKNGLTNTGAFNYPCNAPESTYPKIAVSSGITNTNLNVILQLHFILFGPPCLEVLRNDILSFTGFPFTKDSEVWKQKAKFLSKLSKKPLKEFLTFLGIPCSTKEKKPELINKLLLGLEAYTMPGRFCQ